MVALRRFQVDEKNSFAYSCFLKKFLCLQKYLLPLIMGGKEDRKQLQRIESNISEMSGSVTQTGKD